MPAVGVGVGPNYLQVTGGGSGSDPSLIWEFDAGSSSLTPTKGVGTPTMARASNTATRWTALGAVEVVDANLPRFDYDPITLAPRGLLIEIARTNLLLNSLLDGTSLSTQVVTVTNVAHTLSFYGTGTVTLSGVSTAGPLVGSGALVRSSLTFTPTAGSLTLTVSGQVRWANLATGVGATSFIPTAGASVTRNADVCTLAVSNITGFSATEGTMWVECEAPLTPATNGFPTMLTLRTNNNTYIAIYKNSGAGDDAIFGGVVNTGAQALMNLGNAAGASLMRAALSWKANDFAGVLNSNAVQLDTSGTVPAITTLDVGGLAGAANNYATTRIKRIRLYNRALSDAEIATLAA